MQCFEMGYLRTCYGVSPLRKVHRVMAKSSAYLDIFLFEESNRLPVWPLLRSLVEQEEVVRLLSPYIRAYEH
jgi:hypothetical protein